MGRLDDMRNRAIELMKEASERNEIDFYINTPNEDHIAMDYAEEVGWVRRIPSSGKGYKLTIAGISMLESLN